jgi:hypothetical protein
VCVCVYIYIYILHGFKTSDDAFRLSCSVAIGICHDCKVFLNAKLELFRYTNVGNTVIQVMMK